MSDVSGQGADEPPQSPPAASDSARADDRAQTGQPVHLQGTTAIAMTATGSLTIQVPPAVAHAFAAAPTVTISDSETGTSVESETVVKDASSIVADEAGRLRRLLEALDDETVRDLIRLGHDVAEIAGRQESIEARLGELYHLLVGQRQNQELLVAALDQTSDSIQDLKSLVEQVAASPSDTGVPDIDKTTAGDWTASVVLYLAGAIMVSVGVPLALAGNPLGGTIAVIFGFLIGMVALYDRLP